jgi:hypothetical protein
MRAMSSVEARVERHDLGEVLGRGRAQERVDHEAREQVPLVVRPHDRALAVGHARDLQEVQRLERLPRRRGTAVEAGRQLGHAGEARSDRYRSGEDLVEQRPDDRLMSRSAHYTPEMPVCLKRVGRKMPQNGQEIQSPDLRTAVEAAAEGTASGPGARISR